MGAAPAGPGEPRPGRPGRCQTHHEPTLNRLQTLCSDGTRAVSTYNRTLERWDTTVTLPPVLTTAVEADRPLHGAD